MSYLSKSKWMSFSSGIEANSAGAGRAVVAAGAGAGAGVDGVLGTGAAGAGVLGAGAGVAGGVAGGGAGGRVGGPPGAWGRRPATARGARRRPADHTRLARPAAYT